MSDNAPPSPSTATPPPVRPAQQRIGRFRIIAKLGKGGMGTVYRAIDEKLNRYVALKVIAKDASGKPTFRTEAFLREAKSVAQLDHPNVVQVFEIGENEKYSYIAMELLEGGDLWQIFRAAGPLELGRAALIGAEAAEALAYAHSCGIVHRDIKPANLMLARNGRCKLTDFGLARNEDPNDLFAMPSESVGTPFYLSPEVIKGGAAGPPADVYSLAITLWLVLVGKSPFEGKTRKELFTAKLSHPLPDLRTLRRDLPESFINAMERALDREPAQRPPMDQFAKLLRLHVGATTGPVQISVVPPVSASGTSQAAGLSAVATAQAGALSMPTPAAQSAPENDDDLTLEIDTPSVIAIARKLARRKLLLVAACVTGIATIVVAGVALWLLFGPSTAAPLPPITRPVSAVAAVQIDATNTAALASQLNWGGKGGVSVKGTVTVVEVGASCFVRFKGSEFIAEVPLKLRDEMQRRFGGVNGENLRGKVVAVTGAITGTARQPLIAVTSVDQIAVVQ